MRFGRHFLEYVLCINNTRGVEQPGQRVAMQATGRSSAGILEIGRIQGSIWKIHKHTYINTYIHTYIHTYIIMLYIYTHHAGSTSYYMLAFGESPHMPWMTMRQLALNLTKGRKPHAEPPQKKRTGTQGKYLLPKEGVIWIWKRNGDFFVGLDVRDTAATQSIVNSQFEGHVKAASKSKGRPLQYADSARRPTAIENLMALFRFK